MLSANGESTPLGVVTKIVRTGRLANGLGDRLVVMSVIVAGILLALLAWLPGHAGAAGNVRNGRIFFDDGRSIWSIQPAGSGLRLVAHHGVAPSVSADGRQVVFVSEFAVGVMDANGSHRRLINVLPTKGGPTGQNPLDVEDPAFSPDGEEIIFDDGAGGSVWAVDTDGSNLHRLLRLHQGRAAIGPVFAPDGMTILFTEARVRTGTGLGMFLMNADGTHVRAVPNGTHAGGGAFSPSGMTLVFNRNGGIYRMNIDGSHVHRLTRPPLPIPRNAGPVFDDVPRFSPDGTKIVFVRAAGNLGPGRWDGPHGLFIMNADGSYLHLLKHTGSLSLFDTHASNANNPFWQALG